MRWIGGIGFLASAIVCLYSEIFGFAKSEILLTQSEIWLRQVKFLPMAKVIVIIPYLQRKALQLHFSRSEKRHCKQYNIY